LVGIQLPEKYKENFDVSSEGPSSRVTSKVLVAPDEWPSLETSKFSLYFSGSCTLPTKAWFIKFSFYIIRVKLHSGKYSNISRLQNGVSIKYGRPPNK
jgi:hypothetical protein